MTKTCPQKTIESFYQKRNGTVDLGRERPGDGDNNGGILVDD